MFVYVHGHPFVPVLNILKSLYVSQFMSRPDNGSCSEETGVDGKGKSKLLEIQACTVWLCSALLRLPKDGMHRKLCFLELWGAPRSLRTSEEFKMSYY